VFNETLHDKLNVSYFQVSGLIVSLIGFAFAVVSVPFDHFMFAHGGLGLVIMIIGLLQPLNAFL
jgi:hypothetical protein